MLGIAYNNIGVEENYYGNYDSSLRSYYKAFKTIEDHFGPDDTLTKKFRMTYDEAKEVSISG